MSEQEFEISVVKREECLNCKRLGVVCRKRPCDSPKYEEVEREYKTPKKALVSPGGLPADMTEEDRQRVIAEKFKKREERRQRNDDLSRKMNMSDEDFEKEKLKKEKEKADEDVKIQQRAQENVNLLEKKRAELEGIGLDRREVRRELKKYKRDLRDQNVLASEEEGVEVKVDLDLADEPELENPVKDPETGKFVEKAELDARSSQEEVKVEKSDLPDIDSMKKSQVQEFIEEHGLPVEVEGKKVKELKEEVKKILEQ